MEESSTMGQREIGRLRQKCFTFAKALLASGRDFSFSLKVGDAWSGSAYCPEATAHTKLIYHVVFLEGPIPCHSLVFSSENQDHER